MPTNCCLQSCKCSTSTCKLKRIPVQKATRKKWLAYLSKRNSAYQWKKSHRLCWCHFNAQQFHYDENDKACRLKINAVPQNEQSTEIPKRRRRIFKGECHCAEGPSSLETISQVSDEVKSLSDNIRHADAHQDKAFQPRSTPQYILPPNNNMLTCAQQGTMTPHFNPLNMQAQSKECAILPKESAKLSREPIRLPMQSLESAAMRTTTQHVVLLPSPHSNLPKPTASTVTQGNILIQAQSKECAILPKESAKLSREPIRLPMQSLESAAMRTTTQHVVLLPSPHSNLPKPTASTVTQGNILIQGLVIDNTCNRTAVIPPVMAMEEPLEASTLEKSSLQTLRRILPSSQLPNVPPLPEVTKASKNCNSRNVSCTDENCKNVKQMSEALRRDVFRLRKENTKLRKKNLRLEQTYSGMFNADQIEKIKRGRVKVWSKETIEEGIILRYATGSTGYDLLTTKFPLPSVSSLCRRVQKIPLLSGLNYFIINCMNAKGLNMSSIHKICTLSIDEMELREALEYDKGQEKVIGYCTLGDNKTYANKLLALVARGVTLKWKQVIGWHLTTDKKGKQPSGLQIKNFVIDGTKELEHAGYKVCGVTSDMGSSNQGMWRAAGLKINKDTPPSEQVHVTKHPVRPTDKFAYMADVPHLLKALKSGFTQYDFILPDNVVTANDLPTNVVSIRYIKTLIEEKGEAVFVAASHLEEYMLHPGSFDKMKVGQARAIFCDKTVHALKLGVEKNILPKEALSTAWFVLQVSMWFTIMTSRSRKTAITRRNAQHKFKFLAMFIQLMREICNTTKKYKPYQTGIILSTICIILIVKELLKCLSFVLLGRFTQDVVENLFSIVRVRGGRTPSALQALRALRLITAAQFTKPIKGSSYHQSTDKNHINFLSSPVKRKKESYPEQAIKELVSERLTSPVEMFRFGALGVLEEDILTDFAGFIVRKIYSKICINCRDFLIDETGMNPQPSTYLSIRNKGGMIIPSEQACYAIKILELRGKERMRSLLNKEQMLKKLTIDAVSLIEGNVLPSCPCHMSWKFCHFFYSCRTYFFVRKENKKIKMTKKKIYSSKTAHEVSMR